MKRKGLGLQMDFSEIRYYNGGKKSKRERNAV